MKLLLLLIIAASAKGQTRGDNTILLPFTNYNSIKAVLFQNGYTLANNDTAYLSTSSKEIKKVSIAVKLLIMRTDSSTKIKGLVKPTIALEINGVKTKSDFSDLSFRGAKNSPIRQAWGEIDRISKLLSPQVEYLKQ